MSFSLEEALKEEQTTKLQRPVKQNGFDLETEIAKTQTQVSGTNTTKPFLSGAVKILDDGNGAGLIPAGQRLMTGAGSAITNLPSATVDYFKQVGESGKQELSQGSPIGFLEALPTGIVQGAGNLAEGLWNLPGDMANLYSGKEVVKPTFPISKGIPDLIAKTEAGRKYLAHVDALQEQQPLTTMLTQDIGEELIPAATGWLGAAKWANRAAKLSKAAEKTAKIGKTAGNVGYKQLAASSAAAGLGEGFLTDPSQGQDMTPEDRLKGRFTNAYTGAVLAPTINVGMKAGIDITPKVNKAVKNVSAKMVKSFNTLLNEPSSFDKLREIRQSIGETTAPQIVSNYQIRNINDDLNSYANLLEAKQTKTYRGQKLDDSQLKAVDRRLHKLENDLSSQGDFINQNIDKIDAETYNNLRQNIEGRYNTEVIKDGYNVYGVPVEKSAVDRFNERYKEYNNKSRLEQTQESNKQNLEKFRQRVNEKSSVTNNEIPTDTKFVENTTSGWGNKRYELKDANDNSSGYIEFSNIGNDAVSLDYVRNTSGKDRTGVGTKLVDKVISENPDKLIIWDAVDKNAENFKKSYLSKHPEIQGRIITEQEYNQSIAPVRENRYNNLKENRKDISNEPQARRVLGENTKEYKEIYGERNNPERGRGRSLENSERMPDGGDEQNRRINGDNAPNATDSPKGREFQSEKIEEQAKKPTEGFYAKLIKDENVDIETPKQAVVTNKNGEKRNIEYLDNAPDGWVKDEYATTAPNGYSWYHNGKSVLKGERKSILVKDGGFHYTPDSPDSGEDFDLGRFINNSKDKMDIANSRKQGITVGELIEKNKFLKPIEDALSDISDYTISPMPDNVKNPRRRATHLSKSKMIWLNMDVLRNDPRGFVVSFMHEVQHAKQMKKYKELSSKGKLTPEEKRFVDNYKELKKVNKIRLEYYNKHKKFLDDTLDNINKLNDTNVQEYINSLTPMQREILKTYDKLYSDYYNTPFEVEARQAGEFYAGRIERVGYNLGNQGRYTDRSVGYRPRMQVSSKSNEGTSSGKPRENEERSGKTPQDGSGIDFDINKTVDQKVREKASKASKELFDYDAINKILPKIKNPVDGALHQTDKTIGSISTRLGEIHPSLKHALRRFEQDIALTSNEWGEKAKPFVDKLNEMPESDYAQYDLALKNGRADIIDKLNKKYGISKEYQDLREVLDNIRDEAIAVGMDVGYIEDYYPRKIIDSSAILQEYSKSTFIKRLLKEADPKNILTNEEKIKKVNTALKGYNGAISTRSSFTKGRKIDTITQELNKYYKDSKGALGDYINEMSNRINMMKFFGGEPVEVGELRKKIHRRKLSLADFENKEVSKIKQDMLVQTNASIRSKEAQIEYLKDKEKLSEEEKAKLETLEEDAGRLNRRKSRLWKKSPQEIKEEEISLRRKEIKELEKELDSIFTKEDRESALNKSIGAYTKNLVDNEIISIKDEAKVKQILKARFNQRGVSGVIAELKNLGYIYTMGNPLSAVTQVADLSLSAYKNGFFDTALGIKKAIGRKKITKKDLGIDKIAQEFETDSKTGKLVDKIFKLVGIENIDALGKETFINAAFERLKRQAQDSLSSKKNASNFNKYLETIFGKQAAEQVKKDLVNDVISRDVKYLLFSEISDVQPISLAEMPEIYLTSGNGRIAYMLKTYSIKLLDVFRNDVLIQMRTDPVRALRNFVRLSTFVVMANMGVDVLKDLIMGREIDLKPTFIDNILKLALLSKYQVDKSAKDGIGKTILANALPPSNIFDDLGKDLGDEKFRTGEKPITHLRTIKNIPIAGKLYYWWFGGGSEYKEKEKKRIIKERYKNAYSGGGQREKLSKIEKYAQDKGLSLKDIRELEKSGYDAYLKPYKNEMKAAISVKDKGKRVQRVMDKMEDKDISPIKIREIYLQALNDYYKDRRAK